MANIEPLNLTAIQQQAHALFANGVDYPVEGDEDWLLRLQIINNLIGVWEHTKGVRWRELFTVDSSNVATAGSSTYSLNVGFKQLAGKVKLLLAGQTLEIPMYEPEQLDNEDLPAIYGWTTGKPGAFVLNFYGIPTAWSGAMIRFPYERYAASLAAGADYPDMSNPLFLVSGLTARLFQLSRNTTGYTVNFNDSQDALDDMIVTNNTNRPYEKTKTIDQRIHNIGVMGG